VNGRILALCLGVVALTAVLSARLFEIQIGQGEIWAGEAARLVRSGTLLPYRRGSILDAKSRVLARDEATYRLELSYRDFRRNHVLGLVAHARSALEGRAVPLTETLDELEPWALELAELSPDDLEEFSKGAALERTTLRVPLDGTPEVTLRERRASDVRFYVARLLGLTSA
jgi:cell division protein FtsI/penicillin-binding protein 2